VSGLPGGVDSREKTLLAERFRGFLPVVVDVETGGFNARTDALLEATAVLLDMDQHGTLYVDEVVTRHIEPFAGANIEQAALDFTGINPDDPERDALEESQALRELFQPIRQAVSRHGCTRATMVAHNAHFDLGFINAAVSRQQIKRAPFHAFSCFDTATLGGLAFGQTVLARACIAAGIEFDNKAAHSAEYDAVKTAELFCLIVNRWRDLGGWPLGGDSPDKA